MSQEPNLENLLADLQSGNNRRQIEAAQIVREQNIADERVIEALKHIAAQHENNSVRKAAQSALIALGITPPPLDPVLIQKRRDFWLGVGLFFVLNIVLWVLSVLLVVVLDNLNIPYAFSLIAGFFPYVVNIGLIIFLAFKRPQMALGMLGGFGIALAIVVCLGLIFMAACFVILGSSGFGG
jgi:membrane-associated HD superfamily phosphohydrolase